MCGAPGSRQSKRVVKLAMREITQNKGISLILGNLLVDSLIELLI